jgi:Domain of unknown function (DUF5134)
MGGPGWLAGSFAALMLTVALYCASRLVVARWWRRPTELDTDGAHVVMGVAMAGMLVTGLRSLPAGMWEGIFAVGAGWFGWRMVQARRATPQGPWRCRHPTPHLVECGAMLYMFLVVPASPRATAGMGAMAASAAASRLSFLALIMAAFMIGYVVLVADRLTVRTPALALAGPGGHRFLAPRCSALCKVAMGVTMGYMLILML